MTNFRANQSGDTIVEVLVALAVISFVLAGSWALATHTLKNVRISQERGEAAKIVQSQVEMLKYKARDPNTNFNTTYRTSNYCLDRGGQGLETSGEKKPNILPDSYDPACKMGDFVTYKVNITYEKDKNNISDFGIFTVTAVWPRFGSSKNETINLFYQL